MSPFVNSGIVPFKIRSSTSASFLFLPLYISEKVKGNNSRKALLPARDCVTVCLSTG